MADEDDFLSRWSRRKRQDKAGDELPASEVPVQPEPEPKNDEEEEALLEKLGLPKPESLGPGDDFRAFMAEGVPAFLRRRALRVLWRSNPVLANLDGLNDYDDDFTSPELTKKVLATAYQVGRGIVSHNIEDARTDGPADEQPADKPVAEEHAEVLAEKHETAGPSNREEQPDDHDPAPRPRRMRFDT